MDYINFYKKHLNLPNAIFTKIDHSDALVAHVYKIETKNENYILKIFPRSHYLQREVYFLNYLANKIPVPHIHVTIEPDENQQGAILMEYLPGSLLNSLEVTNSLSYELGAILAKIHLNKFDVYGDPTEPKNQTPDPKIYYNLKFDECFAECINHLPKTLLDNCHDYREDNIYLLSDVDGPCLVHRDFRPGNIITQVGKLQGIIDWSSGRSGFAEEDFCSLENGEWNLLPDLKKSFLSGYVSIRSLPNYELILPLMRLLKALDIIGFLVKTKTWNQSNSILYQKNLHFLETL